MNGFVIGQAQDPEGGDLVRTGTSAQMELSKKSCMSIPVTCCVSAACCFWIPMIFFWAAANVLPICEKDLTGFLKAYGLMGILMSPVLQTLTVCAAHSGNKTLFKLSQSLLVLGSLLSGFILMIVGWVYWGGTTDLACYAPDVPHENADINPRTLLMVVLVMGTVSWSCIGCLTLCSLCGLAAVGGAAAMQA